MFSLHWQMQHWSNHNYSPSYNEHLSRNCMTTSHELSQLFSTGLFFTQKMLLAVLHLSQFLQLTPSPCNKFLLLVSSAHNDSFQYICCIFKVYLSSVHDLEEAHQRLSTWTYFRNGLFKPISPWKLQWKVSDPILLVPKTLYIMCIDTVLPCHHTPPVYIQKVWHLTFFFQFCTAGTKSLALVMQLNPLIGRYFHFISAKILQKLSQQDRYANFSITLHSRIFLSLFDTLFKALSTVLWY